MMRFAIAALAVVLAASACGEDAASTSPETVTTDPAAVATTASPAPTPTTAAPPTLPAPTTSAAPTTAAPTTTTTIPPLDELELEFVEVANGFAQPVLMLTPPGDDRRFVVDQPGVIWVIDDGDPAVFLDISDDVKFQGEQGLLGLAFHPDHAANRLFYVNYIDNGGDTVVASFVADSATSDANTRQEILRVDQPAGNHNGGMIEFGPDGNLWIGLGDGGGANDQFGQGQRPDTPLGAMLRIAVGPDIDGYVIPDGNLEGEVWATGLRNPWRFGFDGNDLWIGDVGQNRIEEVDVVDWTEGNPNFGWPLMEGTECFRTADCDTTGLQLPIYEYPHAEGCSITGGVVYRGGAMPELSGQFLFSDYCSGWVRSVGRDGFLWEWLPSGTFSGVTSFGVDARGEVHVLTAGGSLYLLQRAA